MSNLLIPSFAQGFARNAAESENPGLWRDLKALWLPSLGPTGLTLHEWAGRRNDGTLTSMDPALDWVVTKDGWALDFDGTNDYVQCQQASSFSLPITIGFRGSVLAINAYQRIAHFASNPHNYAGAYIQITNTGKLELGYGDNTGPAAGNRRSFTSTTGISTNVVYSFVGVIRGATDASLYIDGRDAGLTTDGSGGAMVLGTNVDEIGSLWVEDTRYSGASRLSCVGLWDRELSFGEVQELHVDPSALMRLRRPQIVVSSAAVGNPWYAYQQMVA